MMGPQPYFFHGFERLCKIPDFIKLRVVCRQKSQ